MKHLALCLILCASLPLNADDIGVRIAVDCKGAKIVIEASKPGRWDFDLNEPIEACRKFKAAKQSLI